MPGWVVWLQVLAGIAGGAFALVWLHRWLLKLEERGLIYYRNRKPEGSSGGGLMLQEFYEPQTTHVIEFTLQPKVEQDEQGAPPDEDRRGQLGGSPAPL